MRALAEATIAAIPERRIAAVGVLTGRAYALTNEELRTQVHKVTARDYSAGAAWLRAVADDGELPMPPSTQMPCSLATDLGRKDRTKTVPPIALRLMAHIDPAFVKQILNIAQR